MMGAPPRATRTAATAGARAAPLALGAPAPGTASPARPSPRGRPLTVCARRDVKRRRVQPGGIDPHTHFSMPFMGQEACDDFESGQRAALVGGTTMHIDFALPVDHDLRAGLESYEAKSAISVMDFGLHMAVTSWSDKVAEDMAWLAGAKGINSFKFFLAYKGALMVRDEEFIMGLRKVRGGARAPRPVNRPRGAPRGR